MKSFIITFKINGSTKKASVRAFDRNRAIQVFLSSNPKADITNVKEGTLDSKHKILLREHSIKVKEDK